MKKWLNKLFRHERDTVGDFGYRAFLHFWLGLVMGVPLMGWALIPVFIAYEQNEDVHTSDEAWKDYFGALAGGVVMTLTILAIVLWKIGVFNA